MKTFRSVFLLLCTMSCLHGLAQESGTGEAALVSHVEWLQDSNQILVTWREGGLVVIDPITQLVMTDIPGNLTGSIEDAALQPNGSRVATVDRFTGLNIWDSYTGNSLYSEPDLLFAWQVDWSPSGQWLFTGNMNEMFLRDAAGTPLFQVTYAEEDIPIVAFSPDERFLALSFTYRLEIYDLSTRQSLSYIMIPGFRQSLQWDKNGRTILAANINNRREGTFYNIIAFDPFTGDIIRTYTNFSSQLSAARWSPDETQIVATSIDGTAYLVAVDSGNITPIFTTNVPLLAADWSPYGGQIAIGAPVSSETMQGEANAALPIQIIVPDPTLERLYRIAALCDAPLTLPDAAQADQLTDFVAQVEALPADAIPPACAADLIAVAEAIQGGQ